MSLYLPFSTTIHDAVSKQTVRVWSEWITFVLIRWNCLWQYSPLEALDEHTHTHFYYYTSFVIPSFLLAGHFQWKSQYTHIPTDEEIYWLWSAAHKNKRIAHTCFNFPFLRNSSLSLSQSHSRLLSILSVDRYRSLPTIELMHVYATLCCVCSWA